MSTNTILGIIALVLSLPGSLFIDYKRQRQTRAFPVPPPRPRRLPRGGRRYLSLYSQRLHQHRRSLVLPGHLLCLFGRLLHRSAARQLRHERGRTGLPISLQPNTDRYCSRLYSLSPASTGSRPASPASRDGHGVAARPQAALANFGQSSFETRLGIHSQAVGQHQQDVQAISQLFLHSYRVLAGFPHLGSMRLVYGSCQLAALFEETCQVSQRRPVATRFQNGLIDGALRF